MNQLKLEEVIAYQVVPQLIEVTRLKIVAQEKQVEAAELMFLHKMIPQSRVLFVQESLEALRQMLASIEEVHKLMVNTLEELNDPTKSKTQNIESLINSFSKFSKITQ